MRARWIQNYYESPELPIVQQTLIASWLFWKYFFVSTVGSETSGYITQVFRCDKDGTLTSGYNKPLNSVALFEREYSDLSKAIDGHKDAVKKFAKGGAIYGPSGICIE